MNQDLQQIEETNLRLSTQSKNHLRLNEDLVALLVRRRRWLVGLFFPTYFPYSSSRILVWGSVATTMRRGSEMFLIILYVMCVGFVVCVARVDRGTGAPQVHQHRECQTRHRGTHTRCNPRMKLAGLLSLLTRKLIAVIRCYGVCRPYGSCKRHATHRWRHG